MRPDKTGARDSSKPPGSARLVVAAYGRRGLLAKEDGTKQAFLVRGRQLKVYCGDWVFSTEMGTGEPLLVTGVAPETTNWNA